MFSVVWPRATAGLRVVSLYSVCDGPCRVGSCDTWAPAPQCTGHAFGHGDSQQCVGSCALEEFQSVVRQGKCREEMLPLWVSWKGEGDTGEEGTGGG